MKKFYFNFRQLLSVSFAVMSLTSPSFAIMEMCRHTFTKPTIGPRPIDFGFSGISTKGKRTTPPELLNYKGTMKSYYAALSALPQERRVSISHLLTAVEFYDYIDMAQEVMPNFFNAGRKVFDFRRLYNDGAVGGAPYRGYLSARSYLSSSKPEVTGNLLGELHSRLMADGVQEVQLDQLGKWRDGHWLGEASGRSSLEAHQVAIVDANPYLHFESKQTVSRGFLGTFWKRVNVWGKFKDTVVSGDVRKLYEGHIHYPSVLTQKPSVIEIIKVSHPQVYAEVLDFRSANPQGTYYTRVPGDLQARFTKALVEERLQRFFNERAKMDSIVIGVNEYSYISMVADLQRDLVAIHPMLNGNGRTTRLFMNYLLNKEGLPSVRLIDPFQDVQVTQEEWREYVYKAVVNMAQLISDVTYRIKTGLTVEYSPELIYPGLPEAVEIALHKQGSSQLIENYRLAKLDSQQFTAFILTIVEMHPEMKTQISEDRMVTMSRLADLFVEYYKSKHVDYIHKKEGEKYLGLSLISPDFAAMFGQVTASSKERWDAKIDRWYDKEMLLWRGLSSQRAEMGTEEILNFFRTPVQHLVSNQVLRSQTTGSLMNAILNDFKTYNRELVTGDVIGMAIDHHQTGPRYASSYGYSTSKREIVGKAFAMGAMVVAPYGKQNTPEAQARLKSRINVAAYRGQKDIDLGRLKVFDPEFSYQYGRQAEVMGIGGTDPDAVMLVQVINANGEVTETYLRNSDKPNEILLIDGRYVPGEGPLPKEKIKRTFAI